MPTDGVAAKSLGIIVSNGLKFKYNDDKRRLVLLRCIKYLRTFSLFAATPSVDADLEHCERNLEGFFHIRIVIIK